MIRAVLMSVVFICGTASAQDKRPTTNWQPVEGATVSGGQFYIDRNSVHTTVLSEGRKFNTADVMISYNQPKITLVDKEVFVVGSRVQTVVIECDSGLSAPVVDLFFKEPMPNRDSKPVTGVNHPPAKESAYMVDKKSPVYNILCPTYI